MNTFHVCLFHDYSFLIETFNTSNTNVYHTHNTFLNVHIEVADIMYVDPCTS